MCAPPPLTCLSCPPACRHTSTSHTLALGRSGSTRDVPAKSSSTSSLDPNTCNTKPWQPPSSHYQSYSIYRRYTRCPLCLRVSALLDIFCPPCVHVVWINTGQLGVFFFIHLLFGKIGYFSSSLYIYYRHFGLSTKLRNGISLCIGSGLHRNVFLSMHNFFKFFCFSSSSTLKHHFRSPKAVLF